MSCVGVERTVAVPQLQSIDVFVGFPFVAQRQIPVPKSGRARRRQRQWHVHGLFCWFDALRDVFFDCRQALVVGLHRGRYGPVRLLVCFLRCCPAQDARHHGWYGSEGQFPASLWPRSSSTTAVAWYGCFVCDATRAVYPLIVGSALVDDNGGMYTAGFAGDAAVFCCVLFVCRQAREAWCRVV